MMNRLSTLSRPLAAAIGISFLAATASAVEIDEVVVTGSSLEETIPLDLSQYGNRVEVITAAEIGERGLSDIGQTLQFLVPGLYLAPKNGPFDYFIASLQGSRSQDILWLVDGVRIANRLYNRTTPLDTMPAHLVERIEVVKGGQGLYYGTQSVSGVVNIVTRAFRDEGGGLVGIGAHTNDGYGVHGYYGNSLGAHNFVAYGSKDHADGFKPFRSSHYQPSSRDRDRSYDVNNIGVKYAWDISEDARLSLHYQRTENEVDFARPIGSIKSRNERREDIATAKLDYRLSDSFSLYIKGYYHDWDSWYTRIDNDPSNPGQTITIDRNSFWGYEDYGVNAMTRFQLHEGLEYVVGYDYQSYRGRDDVLRIEHRRKSVNAVFAQVRTREDWIPGTLLAVGVRHNEQSDAGGITVWNVSGKHHLADDLVLNGNVGTAFRLPDAWQLFGNDPCCARGNPRLDGEESFNVNLGVGGHFDLLAQGLSWELIGFHRKVDDLIGTRGGVRINSDNEVEMTGLEVIADLRINDEWLTRLNYVYTDADGNGVNRKIEDIPETIVKFSVDYRPDRLPIGASMDLLHVGDVFSDVGGFFANDQLAEHGNYTVVNLSAFWDFGRDRKHRLLLRLENAFDEDHTSSVRQATSDSGVAYLYDNLGMPRTLSAVYTLRF